MRKYEFVLTFRLPRADADPNTYLDALYEGGCDDAMVGTAKLGKIGLEFVRQAASAHDAVNSAIEDVKNAIPGAHLVEAGPDPRWLSR